MVTAINLNNKIRPGAVKIYNIVVNNFLSIKLIALQLFVPYSCPQQVFCVGHIPSELSRVFF